MNIQFNYIADKGKQSVNMELKIVNAIEIEIYLYSYEKINGIGRQSMKRPRLHVSMYSLFACKLFDKKVMKLNECSFLSALIFFLLPFLCSSCFRLSRLLWALSTQTKFKSIELNSFCMQNSLNWICTHVRKLSLILLLMKRTVETMHKHYLSLSLPQIS